MSFGARIRLEREQRGWTQTNLADEAGCTQASVSWYERGIQKPEPETLRRLSEALDVPVETLMLESIEDEEVLSAHVVLQKAIRDIESRVAGGIEDGHCFHRGEPHGIVRQARVGSGDAKETRVNPRFYGCGYRGKTPEKLVEMMDRLDADVMDVRFQPFGRSAFGQVKLKALIGGRYHWNRLWGNEEYKSSSIKIADFEGGLEEALRVGKDLILLCVCNKPAECHRAILLEELAKRGYQVQDVDSPPTPTPTPRTEVAQEALFSLD